MPFNRLLIELASHSTVMLSGQRVHVCLCVCERASSSEQRTTGNRRAGIWPRGVNVRAGARFLAFTPPHTPSATEPDQNQKSRHRVARSTSDHSPSLTTLERERERQRNSVCLREIKKKDKTDLQSCELMALFQNLVS